MKITHLYTKNVEATDLSEPNRLSQRCSQLMEELHKLDPEEERDWLKSS
jgi:hypothetical protein